MTKVYTNSEQSIVYLGKPEDLYAWDLDTDYRVGGNSTASIEAIDDYSIG
jgi:hypothetical protein